MFPRHRDTSIHGVLWSIADCGKNFRRTFNQGAIGGAGPSSLLGRYNNLGPHNLGPQDYEPSNGNLDNKNVVSFNQNIVYHILTYSSNEIQVNFAAYSEIVV